jgi:hypothetical protein
MNIRRNQLFALFDFSYSSLNYLNSTLIWHDYPTDKYRNSNVIGASEEKNTIAFGTSKDLIRRISCNKFSSRLIEEGYVSI